MSGAAIRPVAQAVVAELAVVSRGAHRRHGRHHPGRGRGGDDDGWRERGGCLHRSAAVRAGVVWPDGRELSAWLDSHGYADLAAIRGLALPKLHAVEDASRLTFVFDPLLCTKCDLCVVLCPYDARTMGGGDKPKTACLTQILDAEQCRYCGLCVEVCKPGSLTYGNWPREFRAA